MTTIENLLVVIAILLFVLYLFEMTAIETNLLHFKRFHLGIDLLEMTTIENVDGNKRTALVGI